MWTDKDHHAFVSFKALLCSPPVLAYPPFQKPFIVQTNASHVGLGAV